MCVVSMIYDHYHDKWQNIPPTSTPPAPFVYPYVPQPAITPEEIQEFKKLLERARKYDEENDQKDCELESKKKILKELAKKLGVDISFL